MLREISRIEEVVKSAQEKLMSADNHKSDDHDFKKHWVDFRTCGPDLLGIAKEYLDLRVEMAKSAEKNQENS